MQWLQNVVGLEGLEPTHRRVMSALPSPFSYRPTRESLRGVTLTAVNWHCQLCAARGHADRGVISARRADMLTEG